MLHLLEKWESVKTTNATKTGLRKTNKTPKLSVAPQLIEFLLLEILQSPEDSWEKVVDGKGEAGDVDESETKKAEHQNLVFSMHLVCALLYTTDPSISDSHFLTSADVSHSHFLSQLQDWSGDRFQLTHHTVSTQTDTPPKLKLVYLSWSGPTGLLWGYNSQSLVLRFNVCLRRRQWTGGKSTQISNVIVPLQPAVV